MNLADLITAILRLFPREAAFVYAHIALVVFGAFVALVIVDACLGAYDASRKGHFDRDLFRTDTKLLTATAVGAMALLVVKSQVSDIYSPPFALAVTALLGPRCYVLLADVRDKLASIFGLTVPDIAPLPATPNP